MRKATKKKSQHKPSTLYVAVIATPGETVSKRQAGDWACFIGYDKKDVINNAVVANSRWGGFWNVYVGTIGEAVVTKHTIRKMKGSNNATIE